MTLKLLFPSDYFDKSAVDTEFVEEYAIAKSLGFDCVLFDYDEFLETKKLNISQKSEKFQTILYRGWMLKVQDYNVLHKLLLEENNYLLINSPNLYLCCHHFDDVYSIYLDGKVDTPKTINIKYIDGEFSFFNSDIGYLPLYLKEHFKDYFIMKDNVKSVKGSDFPDRISVDINGTEFEELVNKFKKFRGNLYTGEIILKQYETLKKYNDTTNEWRVFYLLDKVLTSSKNSNQPDIAPHVPDEVINQTALKDITMFYTVDFAETEDGRWIVIETGDGQVSGLSPNQNVLEFYTKLQNYWNERYNK